MKYAISSLAGVLLAFTAAMVQATGLPVSTSPDGAEVTILSPRDGDVVGTKVTVIFGLKGMGVAPAGVEKQDTGHHHLLVDQSELPPAGQIMGNPPLHFGGGQTQATVELAPGTHTLQLILGNHLHIPHDPPVVSERITITVK